MSNGSSSTSGCGSISHHTTCTSVYSAASALTSVIAVFVVTVALQRVKRSLFEQDAKTSKFVPSGVIHRISGCRWHHSSGSSRAVSIRHVGIDPVSVRDGRHALRTHGTDSAITGRVDDRADSWLNRSARWIDGIWQNDTVSNGLTFQQTGRVHGCNNKCIISTKIFIVCFWQFTYCRSWPCPSAADRLR